MYIVCVAYGVYVLLFNVVYALYVCVLCRYFLFVLMSVCIL